MLARLLISPFGAKTLNRVLSQFEVVHRRRDHAKLLL